MEGKNGGAHRRLCRADPRQWGQEKIKKSDAGGVRQEVSEMPGPGSQAGQSPNQTLYLVGNWPGGVPELAEGAEGRPQKSAGLGLVPNRRIVKQEFPKQGAAENETGGENDTKQNHCLSQRNSAAPQQSAQ